MRSPEVLQPEQRNIGPWKVTQQTAERLRMVVTIAACLGLAGWFLQNFLSLRGVVDLVASRINLLGVGACLFVAGWIFSTRRRYKALYRVVIGVCICAVMFALDWWAPKPTRIQTVQKPIPDARVAIVPPPNTSSTLLTWVPHLSVVPLIESHGKMDYPAFTVKNLSTDPISSLRIDWSIAGTPIRNILRESEMLQKYRATYTNGRFSMNGLNGTGIGGPVADRDTNTLPYLEEHGESEINIPGSIWSNLTLRLLDNQQRPPGVHGDLVDEMRSYHAGPIIATVTYMQGNTLRGRSFSIDVLVITTADYAYIGGDQSLPNHSVALAFRSPDNLRAYLRFVTLPAVFSSEEH